MSHSGSNPVAPVPPRSAAGAPSVDGSAGDLETLFRTHYADLHNYGRRFVDDASQVEDAIQDVFLALCNSPTDPSDLDAPRSYLLTSLRRRLLNQATSERRRASRQEVYAGERPSFSLSKADLNVGGERRAHLEAAIDTLSDRRREALYLRFYHDLRYRDVARVMEVRPQSARNYVSEALRHLRAVLRG